jgi:small subunit ribosomal protein S9
MTTKKKEYISTVGRRKSAIARVRLYPKAGSAINITVNDRKYDDYFNYPQWQEVVVSALKLTGNEQYPITIKVSGGGINSQAEAIRMGIARALLVMNEEYRATLKKNGMLTRDPRVKERKKPGLKKARRAPQWSKR